MLRVMIDEETLGTRPGDVILSLGACTFDTDTGRFGDDRFHIVISIEASLRAGLKVEAGTVQWWRRQKPEAQAVIFDALVSSVTPEQACHAFAEWLATVGDPGSLQVWGNGASFDNVLLDGVYRLVGVARPWGDFNDRCFRTLKDGYRDLAPSRTGIHHNALDDALHQAEWACAIAEHRRRTLSRNPDLDAIKHRLWSLASAAPKTDAPAIYALLAQADLLPPLAPAA